MVADLVWELSLLHGSAVLIRLQAGPPGKRLCEPHISYISANFTRAVFNLAIYIATLRSVYDTWIMMLRYTPTSFCDVRIPKCSPMRKQCVYQASPLSLAEGLGTRLGLSLAGY